MKLPVLPVGFAALLAVVPMAGAQEPAPSPSPSPEPPRYREVVEVQGDLPAVSGPALGVLKIALDLEDTPTSVSVVPGTVIESQRDIILGDALKNVSGVNVGTVNGVNDFFVIRG